MLCSPNVGTLVQEPSLQSDGQLIDLYQNFISDFENKINLLSLVEIIAHVVVQMTDHDYCMTCLEKTKEKVKVGSRNP